MSVVSTYFSHVGCTIALYGLYLTMLPAHPLSGGDVLLGSVMCFLDGCYVEWRHSVMAVIPVSNLLTAFTVLSILGLAAIPSLPGVVLTFIVCSLAALPMTRACISLFEGPAGERP